MDPASLSLKIHLDWGISVNSSAGVVWLELKPGAKRLSENAWMAKVAWLAH